MARVGGVPLFTAARVTGMRWLLYSLRRTISGKKRNENLAEKVIPSTNF